MGPITGGAGSGRVDASFEQTPVNELAERLGIEKFESSDAAQKNCNDKHCIIYHGSGCHSLDCIPSDWTWDVSLSFVGINSGEGGDRDVGFSDEVNNLIHDLGLHNKKTGAKTVVVISTPGAAVLDWTPFVDAQIQTFFAGEQLSQAVFDVLTGYVNPSGRLPVTMPMVQNNQLMTKDQTPGIMDIEGYTDKVSHYTEKLLVGYRWYDYHKVEPRYPFGHGLSYTSFKYNEKSLKLEGRNISISVNNTGDVQGKEVVQMYIGFPEHSGEPPKILRGFKKVDLKPNEATTVEFTITDRDLSIWDVEVHDWALQSGEFDIFIGSSSRDIRAATKLTIKADTQQVE